MKTQAVERIRIRDRSGTIKGPFQRDEVIDLIRDRKIDGEEEVFLESEGRWKPIGSDTEFFDVIQEVLFGIKSGTQSKKVSQGNFEGSFDKDPYPKVDATERLGTQLKSSMTGPTQLKGLQEPVPQKPAKSPERPAPGSNITPNPAPPNVIGKVNPSHVAENQGFEGLPGFEKKKSKPGRGLAFILSLLVIGGGVLYLLPEPSTKVDFSSVRLEFDFKRGYFRPLLLRLKLLSGLTPPPADLSNDLETIKVLPINVHDLMLRLDEIEKLKGSERNASTWVYKAWAYRILGDTIAAANPEQGQGFKKASDGIVAHLNSRGVLSAEMKTLFVALNLILEGEIGKSFQELEKLKDETLPAKIFKREISYWATLGGVGEAPEVNLSTDDVSDVGLKVQFEELLRRKANKEVFDSDFLKAADDLLSEDSHSLLAWFLLAKYYTQKLQGNIAIPNRYYFTGLCQLSLWPRTLQAMYWRTYGQFLATAGEKDSDKLAKSAEAIEIGAYDTSPTAIDIDDNLFRFSALIKTYSKAFESNEMSPIELSSFEILSEASPEAKNNLISVLIAPLLDRNWTVAERRLRLLERTFPFDSEVRILGIWFEGEKFRFENAQELLIQGFGSAGPGSAEVHKAEGILLVLGRDYDMGTKSLKKYLESNPQDALTQYFLARSFFEQEKYVECVRFAQLSQLNSLGPLKLRSQTMNFRCRVLANLGVDQALREFSQFIAKFPQTSTTREEYVRALLDADRSQEAVKIAEKDVMDNPQSGSLKILLGEVYEKRGSNNEALALYNAARKVDPKISAKAAYHIADLFFKERRYPEAAENYSLAADKDVEFPELYLKAARAYAKAGDLNKAQAMYFLEVERRPAVLDTFIEASEFLLESNRPAEVPELFKRFSENFRSDPRVLTRLSQAYFAMGDNANARSNAELAVRLNPTEAEPYRILGMLFETMGQYPLAKMNYEKYLQLVPQAPEAASLRQKLSMQPFSSP